jgi:hypothetical protein
MLLRRMTQHVRDQNWFAVGLDFLIVVVGVYMGVLLGNWNGTRQQRALYDQSYDRMIVEIQDNVRSLEESYEALKVPLATVQLAIEDLRACRTDDEAVARVQAAFAPLGRTRSFHVNSVAIDQLINNDDFLPFQSPEQRKRLLNLASELKVMRESSAAVASRSTESELDGGMTEKGPLVYSGPAEIVDVLMNGGDPTPETLRATRLKTSLSEACRNESFLAHFYVWEDNVYYQSVFSLMNAKRLRAELEALGHPMEDAEASTAADEDAP